MNAFRLADTALCHEQDCNTVFDMVQHRACPGCGSGEYSAIESFLRERQGRAFEATTVRELERAGALKAWKIVGLKRESYQAAS